MGQGDVPFAPLYAFIKNGSNSASWITAYDETKLPAAIPVRIRR